RHGGLLASISRDGVLIQEQRVESGYACRTWESPNVGYVEQIRAASEAPQGEVGVCRAAQPIESPVSAASARGGPGSCESVATAPGLVQLLEQSSEPRGLGIPGARLRRLELPQRRREPLPQTTLDAGHDRAVHDALGLIDARGLGLLEFLADPAGSA